jgi:hypothetical protein
MKEQCRKLKLFATGLLVIAYLAALSAPICGQSFYGSVVGTVTDPSGAVIPSASVTLTNTGTNEKRSAQTDAAGSFRFVNLVPANYRLEVEAAGFKHMTREPIVVQVESAVRTDARLEVGALNETVEVTAATALLQTETSTLSQVVEGQQLQEMPLNGRNPLNLIALTAGVVPQGGSTGAAQMNGGTNTAVTGWGNIQIGGGIANQSAFYIDGAPANAYQNFVALIPTQDAIQEFRVASNNISAEFGRFGGGVVSMTTKSGTNAFHGSVYEYVRNSRFNANNFFSNLNGQARPKWNQNQYGATVGGPVVKDKVFFFFSWEGFKARLGQPISTNVPTAAMRAGTINKKLTFPSAIPTSCYSYPSTNVTQINPSCFDSTAKYMLGYYWPLPNSNNASQNYFGTPSYGNDSNQYNMRIDYNLSDRQRLFGRYTYFGTTDLPLNLFDNSTANPYANNRMQNYVLGDTYTINTTTVMDVRVSALRQYVDNNPVSLGTDLSQFGPAWGALAPKLTYVVNPAIQFSTGSGLRSISTTANFAWRNVYDVAANLTKITGRHTLKFGGNFRLQDNNVRPGLTNAAGSFTFSTALTGDDFASFLLGIPTSATIGTSTPVGAYEYYQGYYVTDAWQIGKKLTLNLGLRWELPGALAERHDRATVLLPDATESSTGAKGTLALVNSSLYPNRTTQEVKYRLLAPRVGFAYRLTDEMVLRAGYGISYIPNDLMQGMSPHTSSLITATTQWQNTSTSITHYLSNPFPDPILYPVGRTDPNFMKNLVGQILVSPIPQQPYPYAQQWNLGLGRQFKGDWMVEIGYAGAKGTQLPTVGMSGQAGRYNLNQLSSQYYSMGADLITVVSGQRKGQLLRPFPAYQNVYNGGYFGASSSYNSMQVKMEKRFKSAGVIMGNYTWSKFISNTDMLSAQFENASGSGAANAGFIQDFNNLQNEYSLSSQDVPHRLVVSYVLNLPFGQGKKFANYGGVAGYIVSGWAVNGIGTFQSGYPLALNASSNNLTTYFGAGTLRPNVVPNCDASISGSAQSRRSKWFNTACYSFPGTYSLGNEARTDPKLRSQGANNWDFAAVKANKITEQVNLQFRAEFFNLFNRVRFTPPVTTVDNANFGKILAQQNQPRLVQFSLRLNF